MMLAEFQLYSPWARREKLSRAGLSQLFLGFCLLVVGGLFLAQGILIQSKALLAQVLLERAWMETLETGEVTKAWSWADTHPVARITFPSLARSAIVLAEGGGEALAFGPAHVGATPLPGQLGTSVIGGHRDTHFEFLRYLKIGDDVIVQTPDRKQLRFRVKGAVVVNPSSSGIFTSGRRSRLALVTCYPFDSVSRGTLRYVVFAELLSAQIEATR